MEPNLAYPRLKYLEAESGHFWGMKGHRDMGYADRLYALQLEFGRSSEARKLRTAQRFQEIRAEQTRQARERAVWEAGNAPPPVKKFPIAANDASPKRLTPAGWDDEDSFWEFRGNRLKF
ncbi:hypothetical protein MSTE_00015 [Mycobacteroides stephanolepidis]|uniref:Uncharacterized protein n=2 Tax=[Mycobacterium] stephanolepidis TaxID=1520670 RepID=A0A1Z4EQY0_9MYCO|nr:hypothetical protein MSTE_00015 [[Mycobacterium] stephanolepidis]